MGKGSNAFKTLHVPSCPGTGKAILLDQGKNEGKSCCWCCFNMKLHMVRSNLCDMSLLTRTI